MAKKIGVCPNCKEVIIVNADKKLNICSLCKEPYMTSEAINGDIPSNKKLGVCPNCNKEIIVSTNKKLGICPLCNEPYMTSEAIIEEPVVNESVNSDDDLAFIAKGLNFQIEENEKQEKEYQRKLDRARSFAIRERYSDALKIYEALIDEDPSDMNGYMGIIRVTSKNYTEFEGEAIDDAINVAKQISRTDDIEIYDPDYEQYVDARSNYIFEKNLKIKRQKEEEERKRKEEERRRQDELARKKAEEERIKREKEEALRLKAIEDKKRQEAQELKEGIEYYIVLIENHIKELRIKYGVNFKKELYSAKSLIEVKDIYFTHIGAIDRKKKLEDEEEERKRQEAVRLERERQERIRKEEEERKRKEELARQKALEEERKRKEELARQKALEEERKRKEELARQKALEEERKRQAEIARQKAIEEEKRRLEEIARKKAEEEKRRKEKEELDRRIDAYYAKALQGDAYAQYCIGWYYFTGVGVTKSYEEAFSWFEKSAKGGCAEGMEKLGDCYYEGKGVSRNFSLANKWYTKAAKLQSK